MVLYSTRVLGRLGVRKTVNKTVSMQENLNFTLLSKIEQQTKHASHRSKLSGLLGRLKADNRDEWDVKQKIKQYQHRLDTLSGQLYGKEHQDIVRVHKTAQKSLRRFQAKLKERITQKQEDIRDRIRAAFHRAFVVKIGAKPSAAALALFKSAEKRKEIKTNEDILATQFDLEAADELAFGEDDELMQAY